MKSCASSSEQLNAVKTNPGALQRERLTLCDDVRRLEEEFSSSGSFVSDEGYRSQGREGDFKSGSQSRLPQHEVRTKNTFIDDVISGDNAALGQDGDRGLTRCNSAPARLQGDHCPSITPQSATSGQPLVADTQARSS